MPSDIRVHRDVRGGDVRSGLVFDQRVEQQENPISGRALAMLRAVSAGRGELICSCEPDLIIDGLGCCDQFTAHRLSRAGLIRPAAPGVIGERVAAELTLAGRAVLHRSLTAIR